MTDPRAGADHFALRMCDISASPGTSFEEKVAQMLALTCERLDLEVGVLAQIVGSDYRVVQIHDPRERVRIGTSWAVAGTLCDQVRREVEPISRVRDPDDRAIRHAAFPDDDIAAYIGTAVHVWDRPFGTVSFVSHDTRDAFDESEHNCVRLMAQWIGHELARHRSQHRLLAKEEQLERLITAANQMHADLAIDSVLQQVADRAREVLHCRYAALGVLDPARSKLIEFVTSGLDAAQREKIGPPPTGLGILGALIREPRPLRIDRLQDHPKSAGVPPHHPVMTTFLGVPILGRDGPIGNLYCTDKLEGAVFTTDDEAAARVFAAEAAIAIENARLVRELQTLQVTRDRFYAMVNHELRNALTGVHGWAELILRKAGKNPPRAVRETVESAEYALDLLSDLLDLSRLDADRLDTRVQAAVVSRIVDDAVTTVQPAADSRNMAIRVIGDGDMACRTDPLRVQQILVNLLRNAIQHSGDRQVTLEVAATEDELRFDVVDRGEGISPEQQAIIFDAYARATSKSAGGTGLGLTLSRRLALMLGGDITVESRVGQGARFTVTVARDLSRAIGPS